jgi:signal transduction histidine kinase
VVAGVAGLRPGARPAWRAEHVCLAVAVPMIVAASAVAGDRLWETRTAAIATGALVGLGLAGAGAAVLRQGRAPATGYLLVAAGVLWPVNWWAIGRSGLGPMVGLFASAVFWTVFVLALFCYPGDLPVTRAERTFLVVGAVLLIPGTVPLMVLSRPEWNGFAADATWPALMPSRAVFDTANASAGALDLCLAVVGVTLLVLRVRRTTGVDRLIMVPAVAGIALTLVLGGFGSWASMRSPTNTSTAWSLIAQEIGLLALPVSMAWSGWRLHRARTAAAAIMLRHARPATPESVRKALRSALHDGTADVLPWVPGHGYVDDDGRPSAPGTRSRLALEVEAEDGSPLALVLLDARLGHHPRIVEATLAAGRLPLENVRLQSQLRAQLREVMDSRSRLLHVQLEERRRLERNLHDGAQQQILAVTAQLAAARIQTTDDATRVVLARAVEDLRDALAALRDLANGLHPTVLLEAGLAGAVRVAVGRVPVRVETDVTDNRFPPGLEAAAYYVVCEALANATKHASASSVRVVVRSEGDRLLVRVADDGVGGADPRGSGLSGLRDRVRATGGELSVTSEAGRGTAIVAVMPRR